MKLALPEKKKKKKGLKTNFSKRGSEEAEAGALTSAHEHTHVCTHTHGGPTAVRAHSRTRLLSLPFQNPPSNTNRDRTEGCATAKIYVCDIRYHKSPGTYRRSRLCQCACAAHTCCQSSGTWIWRLSEHTARAGPGDVVGWGWELSWATEQIKSNEHLQPLNCIKS